jgi:predicted  nucleic acid-binding Zn-ribbon protein
LSEKQEKTKMKLDAIKARNAGLENDNTKLRKQMKVLLDKATTDDELVDALRLELQNMRTELHATKQALEKERTGKRGYGEGPRTMVTLCACAFSYFFKFFLI